VPDTGGGSPSHYDMGALEYSGADQCTPPPPGTFIRGDANGDAAVDISDPIQLLFSLFGGMGIDCHDALDANDDGSLDVADAVRILEYLFRQGAAPPPPFPAVGPDPTEDPLGCGRG